MIVAVIVVIFALYASSLIARHVDKKRRVAIVGNKTNVTLNDAFTYVLTILLTQGGLNFHLKNLCLLKKVNEIGNYYANQKTASRFIAGAWCLTALILGSAYSGVLLSFIMSPVSRPVIDSVYDIVNVPGLKAAVDRGRAADVIIQTVSQEACLWSPN